MNKALLPIAILAALPMAAMADVQIYGRANLSVDYIDDGDDYSKVSMASSSSRLGFRASREFDNGITGIMQIEQEIDYSNQGSNWASRDTFAGIRGGFGTIRLGKFDTPFKRARGPANLFGDQMGDMRNLTRAGDGRFDERTPNTVEYQTADLSGFRFNLAYSLHEGNDANANGDDKAISLSATYTAGDFDFAAAYEKYDENRAQGGRDAFRLAASYKLGDFTLAGFYQTVDHDNNVNDADTIGLGFTYSFTSNTQLKAHYFIRNADADDRDSNLFAIGVEHRLGRQLRLFAIYGQVANDDAIALTPWNQARTTNQPGSPGDTARGLSFGMRFDF